MLTKCTECQGDVSTEAEKCPRCGAPRRRFAGPPGIGCGGGALILITILAGAAILALTPQSAEEKALKEKTAGCDMAQDFARQHLKAPATADFQDCAGTTIGKEKGDDNLWIAGGYVDAQNSFGAKIRSQYIVEMRHFDGTNDWYEVKTEIH